MGEVPIASKPSRRFKTGRQPGQHWPSGDSCLVVLCRQAIPTQCKAHDLQEFPNDIRQA